MTNIVTTKHLLFLFYFLYYIRILIPSCLRINIFLSLSSLQTPSIEYRVSSIGLNQKLEQPEVHVHTSGICLMSVKSAVYPEPATNHNPH